MAELCDICVLPLVRMEEGGTRCNYCWEVTSRLKTFLGSPAARKLVAAMLAEIGCAPPACPACRAAVRLAEAVWRLAIYRGTDDVEKHRREMFRDARVDDYHADQLKHTPDCPNQERR